MIKLGCNPKRVTKEREFVLGTVGVSSGDEFVYAKAEAQDIKAARVVSISSVSKDNVTEFVATRIIIANTSQPLAVAPVDIDGGNYGWFQRTGNCMVDAVGGTDTSEALGTNGASGASVGSVAALSGNVAINGIQLTEASGTGGPTPAFIQNPRIDYIN